MSNKQAFIAVASLLIFHALVVAYSATRHSPTANEPAHLVAGLAQWEFANFDIYCVNPPLTRWAAAVPVIVAGYQSDWQSVYVEPGARPEFRLGADFIAANGPGSMWLITLARWACIPFTVLGGVICFVWSRELWKSNAAGMISVFIWSFEPFLIGHAELITPDVTATAMGLSANFLYWRWLRKPTTGRAYFAGIALGAAQLSKMTWLCLYLVWPCILAYWIYTRRKVGSDRSTDGEKSTPGNHLVLQLVLLVVTSVVTINCGYCFQGTGTRLEEFQFVSESLSGPHDATSSGNRFRGTLIGRMPVPLPEAFIRGADLQKKDFESYRRASYFRGQWKNGGWWYYYIYGLFVKTSHGLQVMLLLSMFAMFGWRCERGGGREWARHALREGSPEGTAFNVIALRRNLMCLVFPAATVLCLISSQVRFSHHVRYALPILGFVCVFCGAASFLFGRDQSEVARNCSTRVIHLCRGLLVAAVVSLPLSLVLTFPHQLAYFNQFAGGWKNGHEHLRHSNLDWGQDFLFLKEWIAANRDRQPILISKHLPYDVRYLGVEWAGKSSDQSKGRLVVVSANDLTSENGQTRSGEKVWGWDLETAEIVRSGSIRDRVGASLFILELP